MQNTLSERVRNLRISLGLSQSDFAKAIGSTNTTVSRMENGAYEPRQSTLNAICNVFGVDRRWLIHGEGELKHAEFIEAETARQSSTGWEVAYQEVKDQNEFLKKEVEWLRSLVSKVTGTPNFLKGIGLAGNFLPDFPVNTVRVAG